MVLSREKIALVVFSALILLGLGGLIGYLAVGHSWNVAASNIDDAAGSMDGYTTILYEGTVPVATAKGKPEAEGDGVSADDADKTAPLPGSKPSENSGTQQEKGIPPQENGMADDASSEASSGTADDSAPRSSSETIGATPKASGQTGSAGDTAAKKPAVALSEVEESYREKNATVFTLDTADLSKYKEGTIRMKGGHRFGVFSVEPTDTAFKIERQVTYFQKHEVDFIVALTPDKELLESVSGIDIAISTQDEGLFVMGETLNDTFYVSAPAIGSVGAILISPSNVVSAKVLSEI